MKFYDTLPLKRSPGFSYPIRQKYGITYEQLMALMMERQLCVDIAESGT